MRYFPTEPQTQSAEDQSAGQARQVQVLQTGRPDQEGPGRGLQLPGEAQWQGGPLLSRPRLLLRLHVPRSLSVRHHRGARGRGRRDAVLPGDRDRGLVWG